MVLRWIGIETEMFPFSETDTVKVEGLGAETQRAAA